MSVPPRLARRLVERATAEPVRGYLLADLDERFEALAAHAPVRAWLWYWRQAMAAALTPLPGALGVEDVTSPAEWGGALRDALRAARRRPIPTLASVATLGLGIGVVGAAFCILWGTVLRGLPFEEAHRLVHFERANAETGRSSLAVTPHDYVAWRSAQRSFVDLGAYVERTALFANDGAAPDRYVGVAISAASFPLLGVEPGLGRGFAPDDERIGAPPVILLGHALWRSRFAGDPSVVGREVLVNGRATTVVGVMPEGFGFPIAEQVWLPLRLDLATTERGSGRLDVFGRLRDGVDLVAARAEFDALAAGLAADWPETNRGVTAELRSFTEEYVGPEFVRTVYRLLLCAVLVLLVCCANVANLLMIRGVQRKRALAVRVSLGATQAMLVRQLVAEALVLSALGAAVGTAVAALGVRWFNVAGAQAGVLALPHGSDSLFWWDVRLDAVVMAIVVSVAGLAALLAGLVPAIRVAASVPSLRSGRSDAATGGAGAVSSALVTAQLALACGLLVAAGLIGRSVLNVERSGAVVETEGIVTTTLSLPASPRAGGGAAYVDHAARVRFTERLIEAASADPGVAGAAIATHLPLQAPLTVPVRVDGADAIDRRVEVGVVTVSDGYFAAFGVTPEDGRAFEPTDREGSTPVAIANRSFVDLHLPGRSPIGARVRVGEDEDDQPWVTVVGVVPDLWERPGDPSREAGLYFPVAQSGIGDPYVRLGRWGLGYPVLVVRSRVGGEATAEAVGRVLYAVDPSLPVPTLRAMASVMEQRTGRYRVWGRFYLAFAAAALLLAALGVYGVLSFDVALRTPEIGVRRALGSSAGAVQLGVLRSTLPRTAAGLLLGLGLGALLSRGITHVLYGVDPGDPSVYVGVALLLGAVGVVASWLPARRAARVDPLVAMRAE